MLSRSAISSSAERVSRYYPEWWILCIAAVSLGLLSTFLTAGVTVDKLSHVHNLPAPAAGAGVAWVSAAAAWILMSVGMMLPFTIPDVRYVARASLRSRRDRSIALFAVGFVIAWLPGTLVAPSLHQHRETADIGILAASFGLTAAWEFTPWKRRALLACHRTVPIRPNGWIADRSCLRLGILRGSWCFISCAPAMLVLVVAGHPLLLMAIVGGALFVQRIAVRGHRYPGAMASILLGAGAVQLAIGL